MTAVQVKAEVGADLQERVRRVNGGKIGRMVVESDPNFVLFRKGREPLCLRVISFGGDSGATQCPGHEKIEFYLFIRLAERQLVQVDVDPRPVVELSKFAAFPQLRLALGVGWRWRGLLSGFPTASASSSADSSIGTNRAVHHFNFTEAIFD